MADGMVKTVAQWVALGALFLLPLAPLFGAGMFFPFNTDGLYFPFITGKGFYIRIIIELLVGAWGVLAFLDRAYRPRFSSAGVAVLAFVAWMFIADAFAINATKAFWSNFERMEGWVLLVHLAGFFFAASAVLRVQMKWRAWFLTALGVSFVISLYALGQLLDPKDFPIHQGSTRIDASLGNSAYLAIYLLFNLFIALWLALTEKRAWLKWSLVALAVLEGVLIFFTETRGTTWALIGALALAALLAALTAGKQVRRLAAGALVLIIILAGSLYLARGSSFVQGNHVLQRVSSVSLADMQVRFTIWHMAYEGFLVRPLTGWGQEGFNYVFNRFYDPALYHQEPWFDRAHNAFIDWLVAGGLPGFLLFLSLFGAAFWLLWSRSELSRPERIALTAALAGYAIHNMLVFDNLSSYLYFFAILALIDSQVGRPVKVLEDAPEASGADGVTYVLPIAVVVTFGLIWVVNVPGMRAATELITAMSSSPQGAAGNLAAFTNLLKHPAFASQEIREQIGSFAAIAVQSPNVTDDEKRQAVTLAVDELKEQVAAYPLDTREHLQLAYAYRAGGAHAEALKAVLAAAALSPTKEDIWTTAGIIAWNLGDMKLAQEYFDKAYALGPQFPDLGAYAAAGAYAVGDSKRGDAILEAAYGTTTVNSDILGTAYLHTKDWPRLIKLWRVRADAPGATLETYSSLAGAYYVSGNRAGAIAVLREVIIRFPDAAEAARATIQQVQAGK